MRGFFGVLLRKTFIPPNNIFSYAILFDVTNDAIHNVSVVVRLRRPSISGRRLVLPDVPVVDIDTMTLSEASYLPCFTTFSLVFDGVI